MPLNLGSDALRGMYLGATAIARAWLGSALVFEANAPSAYVHLAWDPIISPQTSGNTAVQYNSTYNDDRTHHSETTHAGARGTIGKSSGKHYFELFAHSVNAGSYSGVGICDSVFDVNSSSVPGNDTRAILVVLNTSSTLVRHNSTSHGDLAGLPRFGAFCVAVDLDARLFWVRYLDGDWNGDSSADPAAGVGGVAMTGSIASGIEVFPFWKHARSSGATGDATIFGAAEDMVYSIPAGFGAWGGPSGQAISSDQRVRRLYQASFHGSPPLTPRRIAAYETLLEAIPSGVWDKLDALLIFATASAQMARLDIKTFTPASAPSTFGMPHGADRGFASPGESNISSYRGLSFGPENAQAHYALNDGHLAIWADADKGNDASVSYDVGSNAILLGNAAGGGVISRGQAATSHSFHDVPYEGHLVVNRNNASDYQVFRNGAQVKSQAIASAAPGAAHIRLANPFSASGRTLDNFVAAMHFGAALTSAEIADMHAALSAYMAAVVESYAAPSPQFAIYRPMGSSNNLFVGANMLWRLADAGHGNFPPAEHSRDLRDILIPEDVKRYRVRAQIDMETGSTPAPWGQILVNRVAVHTTTDVTKNAGAGGFTDHTLQITSAILTRGAGPETVAVNAASGVSFQVGALKTFLMIEVLERH